MNEALDPGFVEFLHRAKAEADRWEQRDLTAEELADLRAPFATGAGEQLMWDAIELVYWKIPADDPRMQDLLTEGQRAVLALWWTYSEVGNGGLHQFFHNYTGYLLPEAVAGAELLGESELAAGLREAASHLGDPYPRDYDARNAALNALPEPDAPFWDRLDDAVYPRLEYLAEAGLAEFISANPDQFFKPA